MFDLRVYRCALWHTAATVPHKVAHAASQWPAPSKVAGVEGVYDLRVYGCVRCTMFTIHMTYKYLGLFKNLHARSGSRVHVPPLNFFFADYMLVAGK